MRFVPRIAFFGIVVVAVVMMTSGLGCVDA
jgi:hypothetical protein